MFDRILSLLQGGFLQPLPFTMSPLGSRLIAILDVLIVTALLTTLFRFLRRTRATNILWGFLLVGIGMIAARLLNLTTLTVVLSVFFAVLLFSLPILFQPELRRGLEHLGRRSPFGRHSKEPETDDVPHIISEAIEGLQKRRAGALIVLERHTHLTETLETGVALHADLRAPLLEAIFSPASPLHDGAVIVRGETILAAACMLPLADDPPRRLGTRHRAAMGVSESSDAVTVALSEERGMISVAAEGHLFTVSSGDDLTTLLRKLLHSRKGKKGTV